MSAGGALFRLDCADDEGLSVDRKRFTNTHASLRIQAYCEGSRLDAVRNPTSGERCDRDFGSLESERLISSE